jgi:hypothetical protein
MTWDHVMIPLLINQSNISRDFSLRLSKRLADSDLAHSQKSWVLMNIHKPNRYLCGADIVKKCTGEYIFYLHIFIYLIARERNSNVSL